MAEDELSLTWKSYSDHIKDMLEHMRSKSTLTDVTLVCEDKTMFNAHKIILSACSPIFQSIIDRMAQQIPVIYLRGIQSKELEPILQFMYLGNATFPQNRLTELLDVAGSLQVKGIHKESNNSKNQSKDKFSEADDSLKYEEVNQNNKINNELSMTMDESIAEDADYEDEYCRYNKEVSRTLAKTAQEEEISEENVKTDKKLDVEDNQGFLMQIWIGFVT